MPSARDPCVVITSRTAVMMATVVSPDHNCAESTRFVASSSTAMRTARAVGCSASHACVLPSM